MTMQIENEAEGLTVEQIETDSEVDNIGYSELIP
jgi:hypothetical protein